MSELARWVVWEPSEQLGASPSAIADRADVPPFSFFGLHRVALLSVCLISRCLIPSRLILYLFLSDSCITRFFYRVLLCIRSRWRLFF